jgi:hypothetical protein
MLSLATAVLPFYQWAPVLNFKIKRIYSFTVKNLCMQRRNILLNVMKLCLTAAMIFMMAVSCKKDNNGGNANALVNPADANALSAVLVMPSGSQRGNGNPPNTSSGTQVPTVNYLFNLVLSSNGATIPLLYNYANVTGNIAGFYVQVAGAASYYSVPYAGTGASGSSGQLQLPIVLPTNVDSGQFCIKFWIYDNSGRVSNATQICINVLRLGTGALQISLSWNNTSDQDLHVIDPNNEEIFYSHKTSLSSGRLDRDDTNGYGPENIYWLNNAPDGIYKVKVRDYSGVNAGTTCYVTVSAPGKSKSFTVRTINGNQADVVTISKTGTNYSF